MTSDEFLVLFEEALSNVEDIYYGLHYWRDYVWDSNGITTSERRKKQYISFFERYDERVFCYELYHQVRTLIEQWNAHHEQDPSTRLRFQGELRKEIIGDLAELRRQGVVPLSQVFVPDFLLHSPGDFRKQEMVVEVKASHSLTWSHIRDDLQKLNEFIEKYQFGKGLFLAVNASSDRIVRMVTQQRPWIEQNIAHRGRILVWCKRNSNTPLWGRDLAALVAAPHV